MTVDEKLDLLLNGFSELKDDVSELKDDVSELKNEMSDVKQQISTINERLRRLEYNQQKTSKRVDNLSLDIQISERAIRKDIRLLSENQDTIIEMLKQEEILPL